LKKHKLLLVLGLCLLMLVSFAALGCGDKTEESTEPEGPAEPEKPGEEAEVIKLDALGYWSAHLNDNVPYFYFIDKVNEELKGRVEIEMLGGPEVIGVNDQADALYSGMVDLWFGPADFYMVYVPEIDCLKLMEVTPLDLYENGGYDFLNQLCEEKGNVRFFGQLNVGPEWFGTYMNEPIDSVDDLNGKIFRTIPAYEAFLKSIGVECTRMSWEELVTAMDRGTIDGFCHSISGGHDIGVHKAAQYAIKPFFYHGAASLFINLDSYKSLPADVQEVFDRIARETVEWGYEWAAGEYDKSIEGMVSEGLQIIELSPAEAEKFLTAASEAGWAELAERCPDTIDEVRKYMTTK
jgi:TRAP-type C4-dicarboxylate transport system substrate-binding protein